MGRRSVGQALLYHYEALGTDDSAVVLQAALTRIREYPLGLLIGMAKSFRDFFANNSLGMFELLSGERTPGRCVFWGAMVALLVWSLYKAIRNFKQSRSLLLLGCFIGLLFSIPFLPPIDGGNRFYSGSVPLLFALMAAGLPAVDLKKSGQGNADLSRQIAGISRWLSLVFALGLVIMPLLIQNLGSSSVNNDITCRGELMPVTLDYANGAYVDLLHDEDNNCGASPELCLSRFADNGTQKSNDEFFNKLVELGGDSTQGLRVWAGIEWQSGQYYFMVLPLELADETIPGQSFNGCAQLIQTQFQRILKIDSIEAQ